MQKQKRKVIFTEKTGRALLDTDIRLESIIGKRIKKVKREEMRAASIAVDTLKQFGDDTSAWEGDDDRSTSCPCCWFHGEGRVKKKKYLCCSHCVQTAICSSCFEPTCEQADHDCSCFQRCTVCDMSRLFKLKYNHIVERETCKGACTYNLSFIQTLMMWKDQMRVKGMIGKMHNSTNIIFIFV